MSLNVVNILCLCVYSFRQINGLDWNGPAWNCIRKHNVIIKTAWWKTHCEPRLINTLQWVSYLIYSTLFQCPSTTIIRKIHLTFHTPGFNISWANVLLIINSRTLIKRLQWEEAVCNIVQLCTLYTAAEASGQVALSPVHTVAEKWDCRRIRPQSHFSATVWTGLYTANSRNKRRCNRSPRQSL